jgi:hypothetical protein
MPKCWTCGTQISGLQYTCPTCQGLTELRNLQKNVASHARDIAQIQQEGFAALNDTISTGFSAIASAIEWGFDEISWQLQQQTNVLLSIDETIKNLRKNKAIEDRRIAEELRRRGDLEKSEEFFLGALDKYPLDYRIYIGLAETYLQMNKFGEARILLEQSLRHAPIKEIDYKSYSYRLIGHICACEEDYDQAKSVLQSSIELSPSYEDGHYDYAQYCAQAGNKEASLSSLQKAVLAKPLYWYLAYKERNFDPIRKEIERLLSNISTEASRRAKGAIDKAEEALNNSREAVSDAAWALSVSKDKATLRSRTMYMSGEDKLRIAKEKLLSGDYMAFLDAKPIAEESYALANNALSTAKVEKERYIKIRREKVRNAWARVPGALIGWPLLFGFTGGIGGCIIFGAKDLNTDVTFLMGILGGFVFGIYNIQKELQ